MLSQRFLNMRLLKPLAKLFLVCRNVKARLSTRTMRLQHLFRSDLAVTGVNPAAKRSFLYGLDLDPLVT